MTIGKERSLMTNIDLDPSGRLERRAGESSADLGSNIHLKFCQPRQATLNAATSILSLTTYPHPSTPNLQQPSFTSP